MPLGSAIVACRPVPIVEAGGACREDRVQINNFTRDFDCSLPRGDRSAWPCLSSRAASKSNGILDRLGLISPPPTSGGGGYTVGDPRDGGDQQLKPDLLQSALKIQES